MYTDVEIFTGSLLINELTAIMTDVSVAVQLTCISESRKNSLPKLDI